MSFNRLVGNAGVGSVDAAADFSGQLLARGDMGAVTVRGVLSGAIAATHSMDMVRVVVGATDSPFEPFGEASVIDLANLEKDGEAIVFAQSFTGVAQANAVTNQLNEYSNALANVIAHELGHLMGLNHTDRLLINDDPDNDPATDNDPFANGDDEVSLMASGFAFSPSDQIFDLTQRLWRPGTAGVSGDEFPVGDADHVDNLLRWLT